MSSRLALLVALMAACGPPDPPGGSGEAWPEADALFHRDPQFLGADGAYSIDLGDGRVLWTFGDTFIARDESRRRDHAYFVNNTIAIQTGLDPSAAQMRFYWRTSADGTAAPFVAGEGDRWYWPAHGIRIDDRLLLFYERVRRDGAPGAGNFAGDGWAAFVVDNPGDEPLAWRLTPAALPADARDVQLGEAVLRVDDDLYVFGTRGRMHEIVLARYAVRDATAGELSRPAYYGGGEFREGGSPDALVSLGMPELSVHRDAAHGDWVMVGSAGFGATTLGWRIAPAPEGPWSDIRDVYRPPESFADGAFVYAGKAHPELAAPGGALVATYVPSTFGTPAVEDEPRTYFPRFVRLERE